MSRLTTLRVFVYFAIAAMTQLQGCHMNEDQPPTPITIERHPAKESDYVGTFNGVRIGIPQYYARSAAVMDINPVKPHPIGDLGIMTSPYISYEKQEILKRGHPVDKILGLGVTLRKNTFKPILSEYDRQDYWANHLKPYDRVEPEHQWGGFGIYPGKSPREQYQSDMQQIAQEGKSAQCDAKPKYGLQHCTVPVVGDADQLSEYYWDSEHQGTYIQFLSSPSINLNFVTCTHYMQSPIPGTVMDIAGCHAPGNAKGLASDLKHWQATEQALQQIAADFVLP